MQDVGIRLKNLGIITFPELLKITPSQIKQVVTNEEEEQRFLEAIETMKHSETVFEIRERVGKAIMLSKYSEIYAMHNVLFISTLLPQIDDARLQEMGICKDDRQSILSSIKTIKPELETIEKLFNSTKHLYPKK